MDTYTVSVNAGEHLDIVMGSSIGQDLILFAPDGSELTRSSSALGTTILSATVPGTGTYSVLAGSFDRQNVGGYWINGTKSNVVSVPVAGFTGTPIYGVAPLTVTFTDTSTNSPTSQLGTLDIAEQETPRLSKTLRIPIPCRGFIP